MHNPDGYSLGEISARYESSGAGTISSGKGDGAKPAARVPGSCRTGCPRALTALGRSAPLGS